MKPKYDQDTVEKERRVLELRRAGLTFDVIAQELGYSNASGAHHAYTRALKKTLVNAGADEMRETELDRLDRLQRFAWVQASQGNLRAIETILRIMGRRAKLLGLDAPLKAEVTTYEGGTDIDREVQRLVALLETGSSSEVDMADEIGEAGTVTP
jgi:hypothetical protein